MAAPFPGRNPNDSDPLMVKMRWCCVAALLVAFLISGGAAAESDDGAAGLGPAAATRAALARIADPPLGLPEVSVPAENPPTAEKIRLGRKLFFDRRLSADGTMACGSCHLPEHGFVLNGVPTAIGHQGQFLRRNAPTVLNVAYERSLFRDGRRPSLEAQALEPLVAANEMANPSLEAVVERVAALEDYAGMFQAAFGTGPTAEGIARAIASYERSLLAGNSPFDRWHFGGDEDAVSDAAKLGFEVFRTKAGCIGCHAFSEDNPLFTDHKFHDIGTGWKRARRMDQVRLALLGESNPEDTHAGTRLLPSDYGRYEVTQTPPDMFRYKTPSLRNVALTAPYMHDGSFKTLREVVTYYHHGGFRGYEMDPLVQPLNLTTEEQQALVAFLESLTSDDLRDLIAEAQAANAPQR